VEIPDYEETRMKNKKELIKVFINQVNKNIDDLTIKFYDIKTIFQNSSHFLLIIESLKLKRTVPFEEANVFVIEKNNKIILSIFPASIIKKYAFINIFKENLEKSDYHKILKIITINKIKFPASLKKWRKIQFIISIYSFIALVGFYFFAYNYADDIYHTQGIETAIIYVTSVAILLIAIITFPFLYLVFKRKKMIKKRKSEIEKIEIIM